MRTGLMLMHGFRVLLAGSITVFSIGMVHAQALKENGFLLPVTIDGQVYRLEAYSARPQSASGPLPLVVISHGTAGDTVENEMTHASNHRHAARDFARRGWHAVAVTRRGFGVSEGAPAVAAACNAPSRYNRLFSGYATDVLAAIDALALNKAEVDASRILFVGQSTGGLTSLVAAGKKPGAKVYVINFAGGVKSASCSWEEPTTDVFADAGKARSVDGVIPTLWFYAANDSFFGLSQVERFHGAYTKAGGKARLVRFDAVGEDGHFIFSDWKGREKWLPEVDKFLAENNLPGLKQAEIEALAQKVSLPEKFRNSYQRYIALPGEKAMAISGANDHVYWRFGGSTTSRISKDTLDQCAKASKGCRLLLLNHAPAPPPK